MMRDTVEVEAELERIYQAFLPYLRGQQEIEILHSALGEDGTRYLDYLDHFLKSL